MNAARRANLSEHGKKRWKDCRDVAPKLGMGKFDVSHHYTKIKHLIPRIKNDEFEACQEAIRLINETPTVKIHRSITKQRSDGEDVLTTSDELRIAMWFIKKIGSPDRALEVMKIACQADKKLEPQ